MNVLVIAPHPDDEAIGCGGAIRRHALAGDRVAVAFLTSGEAGLKGASPAEAWRVREAEAIAAAAVLGVVAADFLRLPDGRAGEDLVAAADALRPVLRRERPDRVYLPHPDDEHPDHRACLPILRAAVAAGDAAPPAAVLGYEVWTPMASYDDGADVTAVIRDKVRAIRCHASQVAALRYDRGAVGLARYRGAMAWHCPYAEVFRHLLLQPPPGQ